MSTDLKTFEQHDYDPDNIHRVANCRKCQADLAIIKYRGNEEGAAEEAIEPGAAD
jgi:hypothetical protein